MPKALIVVTSHDQLGNLDRRTGYWLGEVTHFAHAFVEAGWTLDVASPRGGKPPLDEKSRDPGDPLNRAFLENATLAAKLEDTMKPSDLRAEDYTVVYFAGGHGAMWDLPNDTTLARVAAAVHERGGVVSAVCHGSAGLLGIRRADGRALIAAQPVTGFANVEERIIRLTKHVPFLLQDELEKRGGKYEKAFLPFTAHVAVGERLVSGQNPQSAKATARAVLALVR
jgi:putative intracellular protease/amidase